MVLPRGAYQTILVNLEQLARGIDETQARKLANEANDALTEHAPNSWVDVGMIAAEPSHRSCGDTGNGYGKVRDGSHRG
jgi:hypothetical protein